MIREVSHVCEQLKHITNGAHSIQRDIKIKGHAGHCSKL